jgi:hypothetical protein
MGELVAATHFWAMRLCEYCKVQKAEQWQTKQLCLRNSAFIKGDNIIKHTSAELHLADCVSITFELQKNDRNSDTVTQWRATDPIMCPIKQWASIIARGLSYKGTTKISPISLATHRNKLISIVTSEMISNLIKDGVNSLHQMRSSNGHVPCRSANFLNHANRTMVKHCFPEVHQKTGSGILSQYLIKNDRGPVLQTYQ